MSIIINIDTALDNAYVSIARDGIILEELSNSHQKDQAGFLQPAIQKLLHNISLSIQSVDAIAISSGPGSYTGLRVGMASAKGLCYSLQKPLISVGTLEVLAYSAILSLKEDEADVLLCPMIDARRMEVFTAVYNQSMEIFLQPCAMILDNNSFAKTLLKNRILFSGNGCLKWKEICYNENALFAPIGSNSLAMSKLSFIKYEHSEFEDLAYSEPQYVKEFYTTASLK